MTCTYYAIRHTGDADGAVVVLSSAMTTTYHPISCSLHDSLEAASVLRTNCTIEFEYEQGMLETTGRIVDIIVREGAEYLLLDSDTEIRLDRIVRFNGEVFDGRRCA